MLDDLIIYLQDNKETAVLIQGHTDNVGSEQDNLDLSLRRAEAVKTYLVGGGVSAERISSEGLGENQPKATNDSDANRAQNRRVEIGIRQK